MSNDWRCGECGKHCADGEMLAGANPFLVGDEVYGCPHCRACNPDWSQICDEPGCKSETTCGTQTETVYRRTCARHMPRPAVPERHTPRGGRHRTADKPCEFVHCVICK